MTKQVLNSFEIKNGKVIPLIQEYDVTENDGLFNVYANKQGWANLPASMYERIYGEDLNSVIKNRRKWLIEVILPEKMKFLNNVTDEIAILSQWLKDNSD